MTPDKHYLYVQRAARFFTLGAWCDDICEVWVVLHGYGQTADRFVESFRPILRKDRFFVAPEGLSRFYHGSHDPDRVGASWMTSVERSLDISDYTAYIDAVMERIMAWPIAQPIRLVGLGFSQGTATLTRWAMRSAYPINDMVLYGGDWAYEASPDKLFRHFKRAYHYLLAGDADRYMPEERIEKMAQTYADAGLEHELIRYAGGHAVLAKPLQILSELMDYYHHGAL